MEGMNNFHYALSLAQTLYDIEIVDVDKAEEIGLIAYMHIGNHHTHLYKFSSEINPEDGSIELPCNVLFIECVTNNCKEDWEYTSNIKEYGDISSLAIEDFIEARKVKLDPLYQSGSYVKYRQEGNKLYVNKALGKVTVLYHGEILDDDGLPYLNDKEALAIAEYIGYTVKYKEAIRTNNQGALKMAQDLRQMWLFHCDAARVPMYISQNSMDKILEVMTSWNRKKYHFSFKPTL